MVYNKKQRIVGTIVLMALVGVLFPVIFDGGDTFQAELESRIPPEPQFSLLPPPGFQLVPSVSGCRPPLETPLLLNLYTKLLRIRPKGL